MPNACVLCLSPRQRGNRGGQCGGEGECKLPAHNRQSADSVRAVPQTGATRLNAHTNTMETQAPRDMEDNKMSQTHACTAANYQQWCQVVNKMPCVLTKPTKTQSCTLVCYTEQVLVKDLQTQHALWHVYGKRFCAAAQRFAKQIDGKRGCN